MRENPVKLVKAGKGVSHLTSSHAIFLLKKLEICRLFPHFFQEILYKMLKVVHSLLKNWSEKGGGENIPLIRNFVPNTEVFLLNTLFSFEGVIWTDSPQGGGGYPPTPFTPIPQSSIRRLPLQPFELTDQYILMQNTHRCRKILKRNSFF